MLSCPGHSEWGCRAVMFRLQYDSQGDRGLELSMSSMDEVNSIRSVMWRMTHLKFCAVVLFVAGDKAKLVCKVIGGREASSFCPERHLGNGKLGPAHWKACEQVTPVKVSIK